MPCLSCPVLYCTATSCRVFSCLAQVSYNVHGFLERNKDTVPEDMRELLQAIAASPYLTDQGRALVQAAHTERALTG